MTVLLEHDKELHMPKNYVDMDSEEIDYSGGASWKTFALIGGIAIVAIAAVSVGTILLTRAPAMAEGEVAVITTEKSFMKGGGLSLPTDL